MKPAPKASVAKGDAAELDRLLTGLDDAGYWTEHLVLCADTVLAGFLEFVERDRGRSQDSECLQFLLEEAKVASIRVRKATEALSARLKAGASRQEKPAG